LIRQAEYPEESKQAHIESVKMIAQEIIDRSDWAKEYLLTVQYA